MPSHELVTAWRHRAVRILNSTTKDSPERYRAEALTACAGDLEKWDHDNNHGSYFHDGCPHCQAEMAAGGITPCADAVEASINFQLLLLENGAEIRGVL